MMRSERYLLKILGIIPERVRSSRDDTDFSLQTLAYIGDIVNHPSYAGTIYSNKLDTTIPVLRKQSESNAQAIKRVAARHN